MIAERLAESDVDRNRYDNTCKVFSKKSDLNLKGLAPLLGFPENEAIQANTWTNSPSNVECTSVDSDRNFDRHEKRNKVIATLPVTSEQSLNSSVTFYDSVTSEVAVLNGDYTLFEFDVDTNVDKKVDLRVMLELYLE